MCVCVCVYVRVCGWMMVVDWWCGVVGVVVVVLVRFAAIGSGAYD